MGQTFRVVGFSADGERIIDTTVRDETGEGAEFYAFKSLHATGVVAAGVWDNDRAIDVDLAGDPPLLVRFDPGMSAAERVRALTGAS